MSQDPQISENELKVLNLFNELIQNPQKLQQGQQLLHAELQASPQFIIISCQLFQKKQISTQIKRYISSFVKSLLVDYWDFIQQKEHEVVQILFSAITENASESQQSTIEDLALLLQCIFNIKGFELFQPYLQQLLQWIFQNKAQPGIVSTGINFFTHFFGSQCDSRLAGITGEFVTVMLDFFQQQSTSMVQKQIVILVWQMFNALGFQDQCDPEEVDRQLTSTFQNWISLIRDLLKNTQVHQYQGLKFQMLKIIEVLFTDFENFQQKNQLFKLLFAEVITFHSQYLEFYYSQEVAGSKQQGNTNDNEQDRIILSFQDQQNDLEEQNDNELLLHQLQKTLQAMVINCCQQKTEIKQFINSLLPLLISVSVGSAIFSHSQAKTWKEDPNQWILEDEDDENGKTGIRNNSLTFLTELLDIYEEEVKVYLQVLCEFLLGNQQHSEQWLCENVIFSEKHNYFSKLSLKEILAMKFKKEILKQLCSGVLALMFGQSGFKKRELGLFILGSFSSDIMELNDDSQQFNLVAFIETVLADLQQNKTESQEQHLVLITRSIWTASQYVQYVALQHPSLLVQLFSIIGECLIKYNNCASTSESTIPLKITCSKMMGIIAIHLKKQSSKLETSILGNIYEEKTVEIICGNLLQSLDICEEETLHIILDSLLYTAGLGEQYAVCIAKLGTEKLLQKSLLSHSITDSIIQQVFFELLDELLCVQQFKVSMQMKGQICLQSLQQKENMAALHFANKFLPIYQNASSKFVSLLQENSNSTNIRKMLHNQQIFFQAFLEFVNLSSVFSKLVQFGTIQLIKPTLDKILPNILKILQILQQVQIQQSSQTAINGEQEDDNDDDEIDNVFEQMTFILQKFIIVYAPEIKEKYVSEIKNFIVTQAQLLIQKQQQQQSSFLKLVSKNPNLPTLSLSFCVFCLDGSAIPEILQLGALFLEHFMLATSENSGNEHYISMKTMATRKAFIILFIYYFCSSNNEEFLSYMLSQNGDQSYKIVQILLQNWIQVHYELHNQSLLFYSFKGLDFIKAKNLNLQIQLIDQNTVCQINEAILNLMQQGKELLKGNDNSDNTDQQNQEMEEFDYENQNYQQNYQEKEVIQRESQIEFIFAIMNLMGQQGKVNLQQLHQNSLQILLNQYS